uniref:Protein FAR1-RELATED SEQUENCE n=1 Tax=Anthurium amnicola TaxID=1678845 RepID=A0A1D1YUR7_9ARAE
MDACGVLGGDAAGSAAGGCAVGREKPGGDGGNGVVGAEPHEGMEFGSYDEAAAFYYGYARRAGFRVSKKSSRRSKLDNCFVEVKFVCSRYGKKHEKPHALYRRHSGKVGCGGAMFVRKREVGTRWFVYYLVREHNHELVGRKLPESPRELEAPLVNDGRVLISVVDSQHLLEFFARMQEENPSFFYALDLDEDERLKNVLWIDAKGRLDYLTFGDAVSFDTVYITSKCKLPILTILGVNHHGQQALFGFALLADEATSTFVWLMEGWLRAVGGRAPRAITTNHHEAIKAAIEHVFPDSRYRFCMWNIRERVSDDACRVIQHHNNFMKEFDECLNMSLTDEEFERRWLKMIAKFELHEHEYLRSLYEDRSYWVPLYLKDTFFGEIPSSQSGSVNSYVSTNTTLKDFLEHYEVDLQDRCEKESIEDFQLLHTGFQLKSSSPYELQISLVHTQYAFEKFQAEVMLTSTCHAIKEQEDGSIISFRVKELVEDKEYMVTWNRTELKAFCPCCSFEFKGYLCRHVIVVLQLAGVPSVPAHYIPKRWMRDARKFPTQSQRPSAKQSWLQRYNDFCSQAIRLAYECSISEESYNLSLVALEQAIAKCINVNNSSPGNSDPNFWTTPSFPSITKKRKY